jgi:hypothetical protein
MALSSCGGSGERNGGFPHQTVRRCAAVSPFSPRVAPSAGGGQPLDGDGDRNGERSKETIAHVVELERPLPRRQLVSTPLLPAAPVPARSFRRADTDLPASPCEHAYPEPFRQRLGACILDPDGNKLKDGSVAMPGR